MTAYAHALSDDRGLAEDAVQETFLRAWKYQDSFRGTGSYEGWLLRICRNAVIDLATGRTSERIDTVPLDPDTDTLATLHRQGHGAPVGTVELDDVVAGLPVAQREVLVLCAVLGYDYESAAALLGIPVGTVRSRLSRARTAVAAALDPTVSRSA